MTSETAAKLSYSRAELTLLAIGSAVRILRPGLSEVQYSYVTNEVYELIRYDPKQDEPIQPIERINADTIEGFVTQMVSTYLTKLEISIGQQVLYEKDNESWC